MSAIDANPFPRGVLLGVGGVIAITVLAALAPQLGLVDRPASPAATRAASDARVLVSRDLIFTDRPDGTVGVFQADGRVVAILKPGPDQGFVRGVMRGMARDRRMRSVPIATPFRLAHWSDGALSLTDLGTGRTLEIGGFGPDNRRAFQVLLPGGRAS